MAKTDSGFDRDFGYLLPFLDKVEQAAKGLADPASRDRLLALIAEEKQRWPEIRALLAGGKPAAAKGKAPAPAIERAPAKAPASGRKPAGGPALTVGSLRKRG